MEELTFPIAMPSFQRATMSPLEASKFIGRLNRKDGRIRITLCRDFKKDDYKLGTFQAF